MALQSASAPIVSLLSLAIEVDDTLALSRLPMSALALDGTQLFVNEAYCALAATPERTLIGISAPELGRTPQDRAALGAALSAAREGEPGGDVCLNLEFEAHHVVSVLLTWTLLTDVDGRPRYVVAAFADRSEQIAATREAEHAAAAFRARFHDSSLPQAMLGLDGRLTSVNQALADLVGRPIAALQGEALASLTHPAAEPGGREATTAVLTGSQLSAQFEELIIGAGGSEVPVHVELTVMRDETGQALGAALFLHDLTTVRREDRRRQRREDYLDSISRLASDVTIVGCATGEIVYVSPAAERLLGRTQEELTGSTGSDLVHPDDLLVAERAYADVVRRGGSRTFRLRLRRADGTWRWVEETTTNRLQEAVGGVVCSIRDVHDQVESESQLRQSEARFRTIAETATEGLWLVTPQGQTLFANARMAAILGLPLERVYSEACTSLLPPDAAVIVADRLLNHVMRGTERYEIDVALPSGELRRLEIAASPLPGPDGESVGSLAMVSDVTEARRVERELRHAALHDALTGLPNRGLFLDRLERALTRGSGRTAVLLLGLDRFKAFNDSAGHEAGDELLVAVGRRLSDAARQLDTVARFGGDEFAVLAEDVDEEQAEQIGQKLLTSLAVPVALAGRTVHLDASIGLALSPPPSAPDLVQYAERAMYDAKAAGRGRVRLFDPSQAAAAEDRYVLTGRLRTALAQDELTMEYQPILDLLSGQVVGMEALARWSDTEQGSIPPERFVALADAAGLGPMLDSWAIKRALRDARVLRRAGALPVDAYVSINISAGNISAGGLEDFIVASTAAAGLAPFNVMLEVTEGSVMSNPDVAIPLLRRLRARGFLLAIDDFGTGHSSLAYLRDLPINTIKIDRSFIAGLREDSDALAVAASVVDLGRAVGVTVIAEGVEEQQQADLLRELGCHAAQGWLWSTALPPADIVSAGTWATGFDLHGTTPAGNPKRRSVRAEVLSEHGLDRILAMHRKGASLSTIAAALNADGYLTPAGLRWHPTSVARAVADATYPVLRPNAGPRKSTR